MCCQSHAQKHRRILRNHDDKMTKELVIISGKGGTGKTGVLASFAALATNNDCDVDATDYARAVTEEYTAFCRGGN